MSDDATVGEKRLGIPIAPQMTRKAERKRREKGIGRVCSVLRTTKAMICDPFLSCCFDAPSINPMLLEKWLSKMGKRGESIRDAIEKHYGEELADLIDSLF